MMMLAAVAVLAASCTGRGGSETAEESGLKTWGDQGNGTYINPILAADYSDPDAIRVGDTYYLVASDFHFIGDQILKSRDLVNWELVAKLYDRIDMPGYDSGERYACGSWAPSIRYHDGKFYVFFCTPTEGLFMTCAENPEGPWSKLLFVAEGNTGRGWEDPCPFWDEDGSAYLGHSILGAGPIIVHRMSPDGTKLLDDGVVVYEGPVAEGTKFHKIDGWYYLSIPEGGVEGGCQVVLRSRSIYGPYEKKVVLEQGMTDVNGPHQGALVDTPDGEWWFLHFQSTPVLGRVVHLQPVHWSDGWPVIGVDIDRNGVGEPVHCWKMPVAGTVPSKPASSDDFSSGSLGLQWQFNHNAVDGGWSLVEKPGFLAIHALQAENFRTAHNTLTQKLMGYVGSATVKLDLSGLADGQRCGLAVMGGEDFLIGVRRDGGATELYRDNGADTVDAVPFSGGSVWLRFSFDEPGGKYALSWSADGVEYTESGGAIEPEIGFWKGVRPALFSYNVLGDGGVALFDEFVLEYN